MFEQPAAEIGDKTGLQLTRLLGVARAMHLGCVGINIRTQGTVLLTQSVRSENLLHQYSPSSPDCQENTAGLCRENPHRSTAGQLGNQLTRNSPEPGIVPEAVWVGFGDPSGLAVMAE